ncbi:transcription-repair coupling factor [Trichlorobacter thiogenes]|uniref:Transcription-repair-coupling factor n=1 Tax=Trichlorobacter thiogenes TaxID=115783 RepID=A0A1T4QAA5_9BACT|nr:transcription-repair coupling factor [Trichlorobacter thiogenes]SKA00148.1 transcription-repair coupling factor [Trichlorobacter thiogenes]
MPDSRSPHPCIPTLPRLAEQLKQGTTQVTLGGLTGSAPALAIAEFSRLLPRQIVVIAADQTAADELTRELLFFNAANVSPFPTWDVNPFEAASPHPDISGARLDTLQRLLQGDPCTVVAPIAALLQRIIPRSILSGASCTIKPGDEPDRDTLLEQLVRMGYSNCPLVEERGSFAVRGGILDIFPPSLPRPVRIEFFGDTVETLRSFDPLNQRSLEPLPCLSLLPSRELVLSPASLQEFITRLKTRADQLDIPADRRRQLVAELQGASYPAGIEFLQPLFHTDLQPFFSYLQKPLLVLMEPDQLHQSALHHQTEVANGVQKAASEERLHPDPEQLYLAPDELFQLVDRHQQLSCRRLAIADGSGTTLFPIRSEDNTDLRISMARDQQHLLGPLVERLKQWQAADWRTLVVCHHPSQAERLQELLTPYGISCPLSATDPFSPALPTTDAGLLLTIGDLSRGFRLPDSKLAVIAEEELFGKRTRRKSGVTALRTKQILASLAELKPGDAMVHVDHGIGIYRGLQHLKTGAVEGDFLLLEYAGNDKLYLPIDRLGLVQRYAGGEGATPSPAKLGGPGWEKTRSKARKNIEELAAELLEVYAKRQASQGYSFSPPDEMFREFEATFPWEETPDQLSAIQDVLGDMQHSRPMDRLVCGDVGYGKTEVALRAAFKAVLDGKQVALLVPTTILASQHFETFCNRLKDYPVSIEMLSRFRTAKEQKESLERLKSGKLDIIIGTHRLLQKDVAFKDLGLLIVDEEQRFGVKDKERLKSYRASVDIMTLTATPIPRTLHLSMLGIRDLSIIDTPPVDRQAIKTVVARDTDDLIRDAITRELERDGQVFYVHNRVHSIGIVAERLRQLVPQARISVAHGQMEEKELEKVMLGFMHGQSDLLLTTTIIESGLDIPRANTMIVDRADTFGLSQLYQLRGRIGRSTVKSYAYLLIPGAGSITQDARERLKIIQDISELGAGFRIATHDLELRGAGDMLGPRQSGTVADIGFELYTQMLEEAIAGLKGEELEERCEPEINLAIAAFIPETYIPDTNQRLVLYKRLVQAESNEDVTEVVSEMHDRYGRPPLAAQTLARIMELRIRLKQLKVLKVDADAKRLCLSFHPRTNVSPETLINLIRTAPATYQFTPDHRLLVNLPPNSTNTDTLESLASTLTLLGA